MSAEVTVVGGGVSGLAAAARLASAGVRVRLFEARGVLGGRATSFTDARTGEIFDNGQHALMGCYRETFAFLDAIGARDAVHVQESLALDTIAPSGERSRLACPGWPSPLHLLGGVLRWPAVPWRDRLRVLRLAPALGRARAAASDRQRPLPCRNEETVQQWLSRHGQGERLIEALWEPLALAALNQDMRTAAAATFIRVLGRVFGRSRTDASIALLRRPLVDVFGSPARAFLDRHGCVTTLNALARIVVEEGKVTAVSVRGDRIAASRAVLATPWFTWPTTLVGDVAPVAPVLDAARATPASPIVTVTLTFDRPVIDAPVLSLPGRAMQWAFDTSHFGGAVSRSRVALVSSGAEDVARKGDGELEAMARDVLAAARVDGSRAKVTDTRVLRERRATFSLAPGQPARPQTRTAVAGLYLASDWVDTGLPATIEGAVEAGHRAAGALLRDIRPQ